MSLDYSPWSQKAAWALHVRGIAVRHRAYVPTLSEPGLRLRLGRWKGQVSVPVLLGTPEGPIDGSWDIALWADAHGAGSTLFSDLQAVTRWSTLADEILGAGRYRVTTAMIDDDAALDEASAKAYPAFMAPALRPIARAIAKRTRDKYSVPPPECVPNGLDALRSGLANGPHLVGDALSYADLAMAAALETIAPSALAQRGPVERKNWTVPELVARYADLIAWRDALIAQTGFAGIGRSASRASR